MVATFLDELITEYRKARIPLQFHEKLSRGESRPISSNAEDLFAYYLASNYPKINNIYINQTLTSVKNGSKQRIKPDIVICQNGTVKMLVDLKMDLGYTRKVIIDGMEKKNKLVKELHGQKVSLWNKIKDTREKYEIQFSENVKYIYLVISDQNINSELFGNAETASKKFLHIEMITLLRGTHPNAYGQSVDEAKINIRSHLSSADLENFEKLLSQALV